MQNIGEELVGDYLKWCRGCEFVGFKSATKDVQGEIDVIGLNLAKEEVYVCCTSSAEIGDFGLEALLEAASLTVVKS